MARNHFQAICQYVILLLTIFTAIATHQIQGRPLKNTKEDLKLHSPLPSSPPPVSFGQFDVGDKDNFRPTMPGNSPGIGHHAVEISGAAPAGRSVDYMKGSKDDFRPTMPGHSPGIGHAVHRIFSKPNA